MKCCSCKRDINRGTELTKAVFEYQQPDGSIKTYGWDRPDGKPTHLGGHPTGSLLRAWHYKHYRVAEKREKRGGDAVTGRGMGNIPTAYGITALTANQDELTMLGISDEDARKMNTRELSERVQATRRAALEDGTGGDNWKFKEKQRAKDKGGPYVHKHGIKLDDFQLDSHLLYAHGVQPMKSSGGRAQQHVELHAIMTRDLLEASRAQDPGYAEVKESDWRDQTVLDVDKVPHADTAADLVATQTSGETLSFEEL